MGQVDLYVGSLVFIGNRTTLIGSRRPLTVNASRKVLNSHHEVFDFILKNQTSQGENKHVTYRHCSIVEVLRGDASLDLCLCS